MFRTRKITRLHNDYKLNHTGCPFCPPNSGNRAVLRQYNYFILTKNDFPYSIWDGQVVAKHFLLTPKRHVSSLGDLNNGEKQEYINIIQDYEMSGYNIYARGKGSKKKSEPGHYHTHIIKTKHKIFSFLIYSEKPYFLIKF